MNDAVRFTRHARVLLGAAESDAAADRLTSELETFARLLGDQPELSRALLSLAVPPARKAGLVRALAGQAGFSPLVTTLLAGLADRNRLAVVPDLAAAVRARLRERRNIVSAAVTSAAPLTPEQTQQIARRLGEVTGKMVEVEPRVDPSLIGGVVAQIGSIVYDGSIAARLTRLRQKLVENA